jgi:hypothetical protein
MLAEAWAVAETLATQARDGLRDGGEARREVLQLWMQTADRMTNAALEQLAADRDGLNPLHLMLASGARGSRLQARQLVALRGLMAMPDMRIMGTPFTLNFMVGHTPLEYLASTFGARKGLADTALKTAKVGFFFKRIMNAVQDILLADSDCGTTDGVVKRAGLDGQHAWLPLSERVVGRTALVDIRSPGGEELLVEQGETIDAAAALAIEEAGLTEVPIRSPVTCACSDGICGACYGLDLSTWQAPRSGLAVGVIAAQSIGEPATQLTMRTFALAVPSQAPSGDRSRRRDILGGFPRLEQLVELSPDAGSPGEEEFRRVCELRNGAGAAAAAEYLLVELQKVYRQQGVRIDDRHFEVVLRRMLADGVKGITEAAADTEDFIVAGSCYGGIPALARSALRGQRIDLCGIRNCTAFGKLIPAPGTE